MTVQGVNRAPWQGIIFSEQVVQDFFIRIAAIGQHRDHARDKLADRILLIEKCFRYVANSVLHPRNDFALRQQIVGTGNDNAQLVSDLWHGQQGFVGEKFFQIKILISHRHHLNALSSLFLNPSYWCP